MKRLSGIVALAGLMALNGCIGKVEQPDVWLEGARLASIGLNGAVVNVRLSVFNPNRFALEASGLTYDLDLETPDGEWLDFTEGTLDRRLQVDAGDTVEVVVPVEFSYRGLGDVMRSLLDRGRFEYRVSGSVAVEEPLRRDVRYRHAGTVTPDGVR
jgi:LEA14-like dessication related protein